MGEPSYFIWKRNVFFVQIIALAKGEINSYERISLYCYITAGGIPFPGSAGCNNIKKDFAS
jgi:hypothetical protein